MAADDGNVARSARPSPLARRSARALVAGAIGLLAVGCSPSGATTAGHGVVIGHLHIPFVPQPATGGADVINVSVQAGQRFSVEIDTSDGPYWWNQAGRRPDSRIVEVVGDFNIGSCAPDLVGCRVPYYHTLLARGRGETVMTWRYDAAPCRAPVTSAARKQCPSVTEVQFDIHVR
jgi:hypothetical protein